MAVVSPSVARASKAAVATASSLLLASSITFGKAERSVRDFSAASTTTCRGGASFGNASTRARVISAEGIAALASKATANSSGSGSNNRSLTAGEPSRTFSNVLARAAAKRSDLATAGFCSSAYTASDLLGVALCDQGLGTAQQAVTDGHGGGALRRRPGRLQGLQRIFIGDLAQRQRGGLGHGRILVAEFRRQHLGGRRLAPRHRAN